MLMQITYTAMHFNIHFQLKKFRYIDEREYSYINWYTVKLDGPIGYFVVCDLHYPEDIHSKMQDFPLAMELMDITEDM